MNTLHFPLNPGVNTLHFPLNPGVNTLHFSLNPGENTLCFPLNPDENTLCFSLVCIRNAFPWALVCVRVCTCVEGGEGGGGDCPTFDLKRSFGTGVPHLRSRVMHRGFRSRSQGSVVCTHHG